MYHGIGIADVISYIDGENTPCCSGVADINGCRECVLAPYTCS